MIEEVIYQRLISLHKAIILLGARQVGKTTLLDSIQARLAREGKAVRYINCDLAEERQAANTTSRLLLDRLVSGMDAIFIDEVQRLDQPGLTLKILVDLYPNLMILVTGSSSFDLRNQLSEALTSLSRLYFVSSLAGGGAPGDRRCRRSGAAQTGCGCVTAGSFPLWALPGDLPGAESSHQAAPALQIGRGLPV